MRFLRSHVFAMQVQFEDIDAGGYVHHPRYLLFAERARYAALQEIDFGFERQLRENQTFVVAETMSRYVKPLSMGQRIWVVTRTVACRKSSIKVFQAIYTSEPSTNELETLGDAVFAYADLAFSLQIRFVFLNLSGPRVIEIPSESRAMLEIPGEEFFCASPERRDVRLLQWAS